MRKGENSGSSSGLDGCLVGRTAKGNNMRANLTKLKGQFQTVSEAKEFRGKEGKGAGKQRKTLSG